MPLRKEPPTPRSAAAASRLASTHDNSSSSSSSSLGLGPLIPLKPGQTSLRQQAILTEDEYTSALSSIIKRDFFPNLDRITAENEYLAAVESDDPVWIRRALDTLVRFEGGAGKKEPVRKQSRRDAAGSASVRSERGGRGEWDDTPLAVGSSGRIFNPTFTPAASTPGTVYGDGEEGEEGEEPEPGSGITPNPNLSLGAFQAQYTSEDNASFSQLLDRDNQLRKRKYAHLFAREQASEQQRRQITQIEQAVAEKGKQLAIEANPDHPQLLEHRSMPMLMIESSTAGEAKAKDKEMEVVGGAEKEKDPMDDLILVPEPRQDDRPPLTGLNRWKYTARNSLMFGPDANTDALRSSTTSQSPDVEGLEKPQTNFSAIRSLDESDHSSTAGDGRGKGEGEGEVEESDPSWSPSSSRIDAAIERGRGRGRERADSFASSLDSAAIGTVDSPKVNGYGFVTPYSTPQRNPAEVGEGEEEMLLRIYNAIKAKRRTEPISSLNSTGDQTSGRRQFELPNPTRREQLAEQLMSSVSPAGGRTPYGTQKYTGLATLRARAFASPKGGTAGRKKAGELTPAARALLDRSTRGVTPASGGFASPQTPAMVGRGEGKSRVGEKGWTPTPQHGQRRFP